MSIIKVKHKHSYTALSNALINDKRLTFETRGLLAYLLSKPYNWEVRINDLLKASSAGLRIVRRMLAEAEEYGYMKRERYQDDEGKFHWVTEVYEDPTIGTLSTDGLSTDGKRTDIVSTDLKNEVVKETAFSFFTTNFEPLTQFTSEIIGDYIDEYSEEWVIAAMKEAVKLGKRSLGYVKGILKRWKVEGFMSIPSWKKMKQQEKVEVPAAVF